MTFALLRHLLESTVFALFVGLLTLCLRKRGAAARHAMWFIAVAKFAFPMALFFALGASLRSVFPATHLSLAVAERLTGLLPLHATPVPATAGRSLIFNLLPLIWLAGTAATLALWLPKLFAPVDSAAPSGEFDKNSFERLKPRLGLRRAIQLRFSDSQMAPALSGLWTLVVIIPNGLTSRLSQNELEAVLLHELAHAKRCDNWTGAFVHALACVFWFYPFLLWMEARLIYERELACDEMVVRSGVAPKDYLAGILKVCRFHLSEGVAGVPAVSRSNLKDRMEVIMSLSSSTPTSRLPKILLATLVGIMTIVPMGLGLLRVSAAYAQAAKGTEPTSNQTTYNSPVTCVWADVKYPEGTVVKVEGGPEQMCASVLSPDSNDTNTPKFNAMWIRFGESMRERSKTVIHLPTPKPVICSPTSSNQANLCACEGGTLFSQNSEADSSNGGRLRCDKGKWVSLANAPIKQK